MSFAFYGRNTLDNRKLHNNSQHIDIIGANLMNSFHFSPFSEYPCLSK